MFMMVFMFRMLQLNTKAATPKGG